MNALFSLFYILAIFLGFQSVKFCFAQVSIEECLTRVILIKSHLETRGEER